APRFQLELAGHPRALKDRRCRVPPGYSRRVNPSRAGDNFPTSKPESSRLEPTFLSVRSHAIRRETVFCESPARSAMRWYRQLLVLADSLIPPAKSSAHSKHERACLASLIA